MTFSIGISQDFVRSDGTLSLSDHELELLGNDGMAWSLIGGAAGAPDSPELSACDALLTLGSAPSTQRLGESKRLAIIACPGIVLNQLDLQACTQFGIAVSTTRGGVRRPVAAAALAFLHALAFRVVERDRAAREPGWPRRFDVLAVGLTGRTFGVIAPAATVREISRLLEPFGMRLIAYEPSLEPATAAAVAAGAADLESLLRESDFVCIACASTERTWRLLDADHLALLKPTAYVLVVQGAGVIDEDALADALDAKRIAGAALDRFESEPLPRDHPLLTLENVLLSPAGLSYVEQTFETCVASIRSVASGNIPANVANPEVLEHPIFRRKLATYAT